MKLQVLGSSSLGNCYLLYNDTSCLIIEAGVSFKKVKIALDFDVSKIVGCIFSHGHGDHSGKIKEYIKESVNCYCNIQCALSLGHKGLFTFEHNKAFMIGDFKIFPFELIHDVPTSGFIVNHPETGNILFATDTAYLPYTFANINHFIIEANYDEAITDKWIESGRLNPMVANRTFGSHMSIETCINALLSNDLKKTKEIILIHLSAGNSNAVDFKKRVEEKTGKQCYIADTGNIYEY